MARLLHTRMTVSGCVHLPFLQSDSLFRWEMRYAASDVFRRISL
jgi:hypothetical protein